MLKKPLITKSQMSQGYKSSMKRCIKAANVKLNLLDIIFCRSHNQKLAESCHYVLSKEYNTNSFKYHGRYPFREVLGCTEFFSAVFSLLNCIVNLFCYSVFLKKNLKYSKLRQLLRLQNFVVCICWICSTIFHINDIFATRCLDYFGALLFLTLAFYISIVRLSYSYKANTFYLKSIRNLVCLIYFSVVTYMAFIRFDYRLHKILCGIFLMSTVVAWLQTYYLTKKFGYAKYLPLYIICLFAGILVEMRDFPPFYYLLDSHAIWHLITACIAPIYYLYLKEDMLNESCTINPCGA